MQRLEVNGAVRPIYGSLDVKRLKWICETSFETAWFRMTVLKYKEKWRAVLNKVLQLQVAYSGVNCLTTF